MHFAIILVPVDTGDLPNFRIFINGWNEETTKNILFSNSVLMNCEIRLVLLQLLSLFLRLPAMNFAAETPKEEWFAFKFETDLQYICIAVLHREQGSEYNCSIPFIPANHCALRQDSPVGLVSTYLHESWVLWMPSRFVVIFQSNYVWTWKLPRASQKAKYCGFLKNS